MNKYYKNILSFLLFLFFNFGVFQSAEGVNNKSFTIGIQQEFENLNPIVHQMSATGYIVSMVTPEITVFDKDWKGVCELCVKMPSLDGGSARIVDEDGKKVMYVDYEIHPKAKWGDGTPVTAKDVKLSWEIGKSDNVSNGSKEVYSGYTEFKIYPNNPKKFTVKIPEVRYDYAGMYSFGVVPAHIEGPVWEKTKNSVGAYEKQTTYNTNPTTPGLYYGPYVVSEIKLGSHIKLKRNPHYFGGLAKIEKIIFKLITETSSLEASLLSGDVDMICELGITFDQALSLRRRLKKDAELKDKYKVLFEEGMVYEHIDINLRNPIFKDKRVRQALMYATDREKLVKALFEGEQKVALHNTHPKDHYFTDDVKKYPFDPKKAEKLIQEAGWLKGADGIYEKEGKKLEFSLMTTAQNKTRELVQVFLQQAWKKIGVKMNIKNEPARVFFGETVKNGKYPGLAMFAWVSSPENPPKSSLYSKNIPTEENGYSGQNSGAWMNKEADQIFENFPYEFSLKKRQAMMKRLMQIYVEEVPVMPLYNRAVIAVTPSHMKGFQITGHQNYSSISVNEWDLGD
jgi:peptide/nickel transport system substrate-binding protein